MLSHADIWRGIDLLAARYAASPSALARMAGLDSTTFNKSKRKATDGKYRWPSTESLAKVLATLNVSFTEFARLVEGEDHLGEAVGVRIPLLTVSEAGLDDVFDRHGAPISEKWDEIRLPEGPIENLFALQVSGNALRPILRDGDRIIVSPQADIRRGDRVVVKTRAGDVMIRTLTHISATIVELEALNPEHPPRRLDMKDIGWISRIIWISQ
ncbi:MAG TPA: helix-turn-helix transcriptional regulator [Hellea balneolensis]|uniref:Helix-turn-helix transcriptional regulator n=1 Tax=Hellea balneolensis TaxID=287478 RepID=A0A7V5NWI7_9PROT|nr:helix-turn-helix transcriptional regulator [Hellea balneolensis]